VSQCGSAGNLAARDWIESQFNDMGGYFDVEVQEWSLDVNQVVLHDTSVFTTDATITGYNVVAELPGTDPESDQVYIVCGHFDTTPVSDCPGADDNATGTAAILATAWAIWQNAMEFPHTVRFIAFDGEEVGELGSYVYATEAKQRGERISAVLNFDMAGHQDGNADSVRVWENQRSLWLTAYTDQVAGLYASDIQNMDVSPGLDGPGGSEPHPASDQFSFWNLGYSRLLVLTAK